MSLQYCPHCNQRYTIGFDVSDYIHICNSKNLVLDKEDVVVTGNWEDFQGEGTKSPQAVMLAGIDNELFGTRAGIEGEKKHRLTRRGKKAETHRQRQHLHFIDLKKNDKKC